YVDAALMNLMDFNLYGDPSLQPYKPVKPKVIRVDNDLKECPDAEYTHISDAIAAALSSDIILVYPGTYFEPTMVVDKPLKIASAMEERPIVSIFSNLPVFTIQGASKVTVDGLVIRGRGCCIAVNACSDVVISHCNFNAPQGVLVADSRMVLIDGCEALSIDEGISVINSSIVLLVNCLLQNCSKHGVLLNRSSTCLVAGLNFTGCCHGLHVDSSSRVLAAYNYFSNSSRRDIYLENSSSILCFNIFMEPKLTDNGYNNTWYNPEIDRGNYYRNHTSPDADGDGVVDTPYPIPGSAGSQDLYPLAEPPVLICKVLHLPKGWSAISTPTLNPIELGNLKAYKWTGTGYVEARELEPGVGYWVYSAFDTPIVILGAPMNSCEVQLQPGWNFIGSISMDAKLENAPGAIVFDWNFKEQSYSITTAIKPFKAYWVYSPSEATARLVPR
ncbi:MAG TPA: hypothetical protein ENF82_00965, partial [Candidatus Methanomethylia archaeon]|nr:hypothetical protein [Candidatus Methanomethylicia archaeon]